MTGVKTCNLTLTVASEDGPFPFFVSCFVFLFFSSVFFQLLSLVIGMYLFSQDLIFAIFAV